MNVFLKLKNLILGLFVRQAPMLSAPTELPQEQEEVPPEWALDLLDAMQKSSRATGRVGLKLEELDRKLEGGLQDLRSLLANANLGTAATPADGWDDLLDALDLLDAAILSARGAGQEGLAAGLEGIHQRLERMLHNHRIQRLDEVNGPPDGRLFKVVGTQSREDCADGAVVRLVHAAATQGSQILREGEVIINRRAS